mgnify:CR=1 FL=1
MITKSYSLSHLIGFLAVYLVALAVCIPTVALIVAPAVGVSFDTAGTPVQLATLLGGWISATAVALVYLGVKRRLMTDRG